MKNALGRHISPQQHQEQFVKKNNKCENQKEKGVKQKNKYSIQELWDSKTTTTKINMCNWAKMKREKEYRKNI